MKAVVVYESLWGNTAAVARAIAEGIGAEAQVLSTAEATGDAIAGADLIVGGAPLHAFSLPTDKTRESSRTNTGKTGVPPDLSHPSMRSWLEGLAAGEGHSAAFETAFRGSPGSATRRIVRGLEGAGYRPVGKGKRFAIKGGQGPLQDGELERARQWGAELARPLG